MRRYVLTILGLLGVLLAACVGIAWFGLDQCPLADRTTCGIYHFQQAKLAAAPERIDLMLLGDSSLGNGVDARLLSQLAGRTTLNLALSGGALGLPAIYVQLKSAVARHRIDNLVIMLSPADFRHRFKLAAEGYVFVTAGAPRQYLISPTVFLHSTAALFRMLFDNQALSSGARRLASGTDTPGDCGGCDARDYPQQTRVGFRDNGDLRDWRGPVADFDPFLARIAALCKAGHINCLYMHGPIIQRVLDNNPGYVAEIDAKIAGFGLQVVDPQPIAIPEAEAGDAINHVRPDLRATYTARIYRALAPLLK